MKKWKRVLSLCLAFCFYFSSNSLVYAADASVESIEGESEFTQDSDLSEEQVADVNITVASIFSVQIPKRVTLDGETKKATFSIGVKGDIGSNEVISVSPEWYFKLKQEGKDSILAQVYNAESGRNVRVNWGYGDLNQNEYNISRLCIESRNATAGDWKGNLTFVIEKTSSREPGLYDEQGVMTKTWDELLEDGNITVLYGSCGEAYRKEIPYAITDADVNISGVLVTPYFTYAIFENAFEDCSFLTGIDMSACVSIYSYLSQASFKNCISLKEVNLAKGTVHIYQNAFENCIELTNTDFITNNTSLNPNCFLGCTGIEEFTHPIYNSGQIVWHNYGLPNLKKLIIQDNIQYIYSSGVNYPLLEEIEFPQDSPFVVENGVIYDTQRKNISASLKGVEILQYTIPNDVKSINEETFHNRPNLTITYKNVEYTEPTVLEEALTEAGVQFTSGFWTKE